MLHVPAATRTRGGGGVGVEKYRSTEIGHNDHGLKIQRLQFINDNLFSTGIVATVRESFLLGRLSRLG